MLHTSPSPSPRRDLAPPLALPALPADVMLCAALAADLPAIRRAVRAAFGHDLEARLVERLEREGRARVSLVARAASDVVGHAMLSRADLVARGGSWPALALAPVAVVPGWQRRGIGSALVRACLALAGPSLPIFVIGAPAFYDRFGFEQAEPYGVTSRFDVPLDHFMVRPGAGAPAPLPRLLDYPAAWRLIPLSPARKTNVCSYRRRLAYRRRGRHSRVLWTVCRLRSRCEDNRVPCWPAPAPRARPFSRARAGAEQEFPHAHPTGHTQVARTRQETTPTEVERVATETGEHVVIQPKPEWSANAWIKSEAEYKAMYERSIEDPEGFWSERAAEIDWTKKWDKVVEWQFEPVPSIKYFIGAELNASYNCVDRWVEAGKGDKPAIIFEGDPSDSKVTTYAQLKDEVSKFANVLKKHGVKKGDRVALYLPMIAELPVVMLACARIGAIHMMVFGGFSAEALKARIDNCGAKILICADKGYRGTKTTASKTNADVAIAGETTVEKVIVIKRVDGDVPMTEGRDLWYHDEMAAPDITTDCAPVPVDAEHPLFILYTSGSTGTPKGVLHSTGGYLVFVHDTAKYVFNLHDDDIHFCTADIGWITGHSFIVYGPLSNGVSSILFEGLPTSPNPDRYWEVVEKHKATTVYTAPTVIRSLKGQDVSWAEKHDMPSLRVLGSVGEPIDAESWLWYYEKVGKGRIPLVDTWWQTETGGLMVTPLPGVSALKPGSAGKPFFGVKTVVMKDNGEEAAVGEQGQLCISRPWPGMIRGTWGDEEGKRFKEVYFTMYKGLYNTGDGCEIDADGDHWLKGRIDDVLNVSGHRIGTADVESALVSHPAVAEAAVVGYPHEIKGTGIYTYVTLIEGVEPSDDLRKELAAHVRKVVGPIATPDKMQFADTGLPKTRSGKIMRRILRKIAEGEFDSLGDTSTLADPAVVEDLKAGRQ